MSSNKFMSKNDIILIIQWQGDLFVTNRMPKHISPIIPMHVRVILHILCTYTVVVSRIYGDID